MGKTMFGLFRGPLGVLERRMLSFTSEDDARKSMSSEMIEVRVYRSKGRRKIEPVVEEYKSSVDGSGKTCQVNGAGIRYACFLLTLHNLLAHILNERSSTSNPKIADARITQVDQCRFPTPS